MSYSGSAIAATRNDQLLFDILFRMFYSSYRFRFLLKNRALKIRWSEKNKTCKIWAFIGFYRLLRGAKAYKVEAKMAFLKRV